MIVPKVGDICQHYKGGLYKVICWANMEADNKAIVVYRSQEDGHIWARPTQEFLDKFTVVNTKT